ncbi:MAG TPA: hypothetical protein VMU75_08295 [Acidimicrobiales bacterium]|nr:hypothetical protein [Acidimicrobiales bacterium]
MAHSPPGDDADQGRDRVDELQGEIERLHARVARLEAEKAALLRAAARRDYERPPHYQ